MPWNFRKVGNKTCAYNKNTGKKKGCTTGSAKKYKAALYINAMEKSKMKTFKEYCESITGVDGNMDYADTATAEDAGTLSYGSSDTAYGTEPGQNAPEEMLANESGKKGTMNKVIKYLSKFIDKPMPAEGEDLQKFLKDLSKMAEDLQKVGIEPIDILATIKQPNMAKQYLIRGPSVKGNTGKGALEDLKDLLQIEILEDEDSPGGPNVNADPTTEMSENFINHKGPGRPGDSKRHGIKKRASLSSLDKIVHSKTASPRKKQLAHWQANMRRGKAKHK
jgi:hypothetical protein